MGLTAGLPRESKLRKVIRNTTGSHRDWQEASKELSLLPIGLWIYSELDMHPGNPAQELKPYHPHVVTSLIPQTTKPPKGSRSPWQNWQTFLVLN